MILHIDIETYSEADLTKTGVYRYAEDPSFEILLFGVAVDDNPVVVYDLKKGEEIPDEIISALQDNTITKWAFNAQFERVCLSRYLWDKGLLTRGTYLDPHGWRCDMVWAGYMGFPMNLKGAGSALQLDEQKMEEGKSLITYFCKPYRATSKNGYSNRNLPSHDPEKWELFKTYNKRDVEVEMAIASKLSAHPVPEKVWEEYWEDQTINDRGILIDIPMVENATELDKVSKSHLKEEMQSLSGLKNPQSVIQMQQWLKENGVELDSLGKKEIEAELEGIPEPMRSVLLLRQQLAMSAVKKYQAMDTAACSDGRCRGMFQFYGANRSGRFSGRIIQLQNLFRNSLPDLDSARALVKQGNYEALSLLYDSIPEVLAQCVRTAFIPAPGYKFIVSDFSAIEARVLAWLAGEQWVLDVFASGGDIYCETTSRMFGVPVVKHGINGDLRQKGKQATLSCIAEGQLVLTDRGLVPIEEVTLDDKVWDGEKWVEHEGVVYKGEREVIAYEGLTATEDHLVWVEGELFPLSFGDAARNGLHLLQTGGRVTYSGTWEKSGIRKVYDILNAGPYHRFTVSGYLVHNCGYGGGVGALKAMGAIEAGMKEEELGPLVDAWRASNPNIVKLWYAVDRAAKTAIKDKTTINTHGLEFKYRGGMLYITLPSGRHLSYVRPRIGENRYGGESVTYMGTDFTKHWARIETFGGKLVENCVQAISRDILCSALEHLSTYRVVAHVHDECIVEVPPSTTVEEISSLMSIVPEWAPGLVLRADGYECPGYYLKD